MVFLSILLSSGGVTRTNGNHLFTLIYCYILKNSVSLQFRVAGGQSVTWKENLSVDMR